MWKYFKKRAEKCSDIFRLLLKQIHLTYFNVLFILTVWFQAIIYSWFTSLWMFANSPQLTWCSTLLQNFKAIGCWFRSFMWTRIAVVRRYSTSIRLMLRCSDFILKCIEEFQKRQSILECYWRVINGHSSESLYFALHWLGNFKTWCCLDGRLKQLGWPLN